MFLHSGAAFHGHEYSPSQKRILADSPLRASHTANRAPLTRSPFSTPISTKSTIYENPLPILSIPERPSSAQSPRRTDPMVRFQDPDTMSEDGRSIANSDGSDTTAGGKRKRRTKTNTTFHIAVPAPTLTQKQRLLEIRPKLLLQLQRLSADSRPVPEVDVLPSTLVVPRVAKKFPRMFRGKGELGCNDVMVVKSEEYCSNDDFPDSSDSDEDSLANRDLMAVICQMRKDLGGSSGKAEMVLNDGSIWIATPSPNGLYEFVSTDESGHRKTARWVKRSMKHCSVNETTGIAESKFTFSMIDPNSRRHPILATITQNSLTIPDHYTSVSPSAGKLPPPSLYKENGEEVSSERMTCVIDESTKRFIQVTGIWLALREGWSPYFKYSDTMSSTTRVRSMSLTPEASRPNSVLSNNVTPDPAGNSFAGIGCKMRRVSTDRLPKRTVSTGTAFMQKEKARRLGIPPVTAASDSEGEGGTMRRDFLDKSLNIDQTPTSPLPNCLPISGSTTPETPTRPSKRLSLPAVSLPKVAMNHRTQRHSMLEMKDQQPIPKKKVSRWKGFVNIFRRSKTSV